MINTIKDRKNLFLNLSNRDWITKLKSLIVANGNYILRPSDGKFALKMPGIAWDSPWVYTLPDTKARCGLHHRVFFNVLNHVHSYCRGCWKVVVRPRNLIELFDLYEFQRVMDVPCKCGIEIRETVHGLYGGYFYNRGKEEGLKRYKEVRTLVNKHLSRTTPVLLKRYCTEFEIGKEALGPSDKLPDITFEEREMELEVEGLFATPETTGTTAHDLIDVKTMLGWIMFAYKNGDPTYKEFTDNGPMFPSYVTYHNEKE